MAGRRAASVVLLCLAWAGAAFGEPQPSREDFARALIQQSPIVDDVGFQLPVEVYRRYLMEQATRPQPAPVAYIIERGLYGVTLDANSRPVMRAELSIRVLDPPRCRQIRVLSTALAWEAVTVNAKPGKLAAKNGWLSLMPDKPGVYELAATAKLGRKWAKEARVALDAPRSVRTGVKFDSAGAWHVSAAGSTGLTAAGSTGLTASAPAEAGTHVELAMPPTDRIDVAWTRPVKLPPRPPQFEIGGAIAWNIDAGRQQLSARMNIRILGGATDRLELSIPAGAVRCEITGPDVRQTRVSGTSASVFLRGKVTGQTRLSVSYELPGGPTGQGAAGLKPLPAPRLADGHWSGGTLVVTNTAGACELLADNVRSLRELHEGDIPADARAILAGRPVLAYEIIARDFDAAVEVLDLGEFALQESIADLAHYQVLFRPDGSIMCKVDYEIRNRTSQFLRVHMPGGSTVLSARVNDVPTALSPAAGEAGVCLLPLVRSKASVKGLVSFPVQIVLLYRGAALARRGLADVPLPTIDLPIAYGWCDLFIPPGMDVRQWSGPMRSVERLSSETAIASLSYGAGELAEGYREEKRIKVVTAPQTAAAERGDKLGETAFKPKLEPKPRAKPAAEAGFSAIGAIPPRPTTQPAELTPIVSKLPVVGRLSDRAEQAPPKRKAIDDSFVDGAPATQPGQTTTEFIVGGGAVVTNGILRPTTQPASILLPARQPPAGAVQPVELPTVATQQLETTVSVPEGGTLMIGGQKAGQSLLARNYYSAGKEYYEKGRLDEAAESLQNAARLAPGSVEADNARRLLANIDVVRGKAKTVSRQEKALGRQVMAENAGLNLALEQQQQELLEQAGAALKSGRSGVAQAAYKAAEGLGEQLLAQGAARSEQDARLRQARQELEQLGKAQSEQARQFRLRYEQLKGGGDVEQALAVGNALKALSAEGEQKKALTGELEKLAIASVRETSSPYLRSQMSLDVAPRDKAGSGKWITQTTGKSGTMPTDIDRQIQRAKEILGAAANELAQINIQREASDKDQAPKEANEIEPHRALEQLRMALASGSFQRQPAAQGGHATAQPEAGVFARVYDVRDLAIGSDGKRTAEDINRRAEDLAAKAQAAIGSPAGRADGRAGRVAVDNGRLIVMAGVAGQDTVRQLLDKLREIRGPQVELGGNIAGQEASGLVKMGAGTLNLSGVNSYGGDAVVSAGTAVNTGGTFLDDIRVDFEARAIQAQPGPAGQPGTPIEATEGSKAQFEDFIRRNYDWQISGAGLAHKGGGAGGGGGGAPGGAWGAWGSMGYRGFDYWVRDWRSSMAGGFVYDDFTGAAAAGRGRHADSDSDDQEGREKVIERLAARLSSNIGQSVVVNSSNINIAAADAAQLGIEFRQGVNSVRYATVDEAQLRTLRQLAARQAEPGQAVKAVAANPRLQNTIVGTEALLAGGQRAYVARALEGGNTFELAGNPIDLPHEKYVLLDAGGYITAAKASQMRHWTQPVSQEDVGFADVPQELDVPRVGNLVRFEKTLIRPADRLTIRAEYTWKGDAK